MIDMKVCQNEFLKSFTKRDMVEMSSGKGQDFCEAMGEAIFNILNKENIVFMAHTHVCSAPGAPSATPVPPSLFVDPEPEE